MEKSISIICVFIISFCSFGQESTRENSIVIETNAIMMTSISYDRYIAINERASLIFGGEYVMGTGFGWGAHWLVPEVGVLAFGPKHFMETGIQVAFDISPSSEDIEMYGRDNSLGVRVAYRFQTNRGFNIRANINTYFSIDPIVFPTVGIGYSF